MSNGINSNATRIHAKKNSKTKNLIICNVLLQLLSFKYCLKTKKEKLKYVLIKLWKIKKYFFKNTKKDSIKLFKKLKKFFKDINNFSKPFNVFKTLLVKKFIKVLKKKILNIFNFDTVWCCSKSYSNITYRKWNLLIIYFSSNAATFLFCSLSLAMPILVTFWLY